jgi:ribonucleoside-triphosphate reductase
MNEACLNAKWIGASLAEENAQKWTAEVLVHMRNRLSDYQEEYGDLYNLEATPAESTSFRLAKHDLAKFPDIITANGSEDSPYYTNSSHLPVDYTEDMFAALDIQDELQTLYTSGTVFHAFLGEKMPSWESAAKLVRMIANNYRLPYYTISPVYSVCPEHGYIAGEHNKCPLCGQEAEVYARITGYYRPVKNWNKGKSAEYKKRKAYIAPEIDVLTCKPRVKKVQNVTEQTTLFPETDSLVIVTKKNCPKCKSLKAELDRRGIRYEELDGESEKNLAFVKDNNVMSAPTAFLNGKKYVGDKVLNAV